MAEKLFRFKVKIYILKWASAVRNLFVNVHCLSETAPESNEIKVMLNSDEVLKFGAWVQKYRRT